MDAYKGKDFEAL